MIKYRGYALYECDDHNNIHIWWRNEVVDNAPTLQAAKDKIDGWLNAR